MCCKFSKCRFSAVRAGLCAGRVLLAHALGNGGPNSIVSILSDPTHRTRLQRWFVEQGDLKIQSVFAFGMLSRSIKRAKEAGASETNGLASYIENTLAAVGTRAEATRLHVCWNKVRQRVRLERIALLVRPSKKML